MKKCIIRYRSYGSNADCFYTEDGGKSAKQFASVSEATVVVKQLRACGHSNVHYLIVK